MKTIRLVILSLAFLFGMARAQVTELPIGSPEKVMQWSLENSKELFLYIYQDNKTYGVVVAGNPKTFPKFKTKEDVDSYFSKKLAIATGSVVNSDNGQDKNRPFKVWATLRRFSDQEKQYMILFSFEGEFSLIKQGDGSYKLPDLSGIRLELPPFGVQVLVPDIKWVRVETPDVTHDSSVNNTNPQLLWHGRVLMIPLDIAMSPYTTIRLISGTNFSYQVFGPDGKPQLEEPVRLILGSHPSTTTQAKKASEPVMSIEIRGGGVGRVLQLQQASTPQGPWFDTEGGKFTRWSSEPIFRFVSNAEENIFYRVRLVKEIPTYGD
jgi:hypothetical protein